MKKLQFAVFLIFSFALTIFSQSDIVAVTSIVKIKNEKHAEAAFYYDNNWKVLRKQALQKGYIHSYEFIEARADEKTDFDFITITRFTDQAQYEKAEENFRVLMEPRGGPKLLNDLKPDDFREIVFVMTGKSLFATVGLPDAKTSGQCDSADLKFFDFLNGNWKGKDGASKVSVTKILNGCGSRELWAEKESDSDRIFLANLTRTYDAASKKWYLTFIANDLVPQVWEGRFENGNWYFYRDWELNGKPRRSRTFWQKTSDQGFERIVEQLNDDGKTWRLHVKSGYTKN